MKNKNIVISCIIGNTLEYYDLALYTIFSPIIAHIFFPSINSLTSLLSSWGAFASGFIMRPLGGVFFGIIGDKWGRKIALLMSILLMGIPTMVIGVLPGYESLGLISPIILVLCRLLQGLCAGGEHNGAAILLLEHKQSQPGLMGGLISGSCFIGILIATIFGAICVTPKTPEYSWRLAFILGGGISLIGLLMRLKTTESPVYLALNSLKKELMPFREVIKNYKIPSVLSCSIGALDGVLCYTLFGFLPFFLNRYLNINFTNALQINVIGLISCIILIPLVGYLSDFIGHKNTLVSSAFFIMMMAIPAFLLITVKNVFFILGGQFILSMFIAGVLGPQHAFFQKLFPSEIRYTAISLSYNVGLSLGGGITPMLNIILIEYTSNVLAPVVLLIGFALLNFVALFITFSKTISSKA